MSPVGKACSNDIPPQIRAFGGRLISLNHRIAVLVISKTMKMARMSMMIPIMSAAAAAIGNRIMHAGYRPLLIDTQSLVQQLPPCIRTLLPVKALDFGYRENGAASESGTSAAS